MVDCALIVMALKCTAFGSLLVYLHKAMAVHGHCIYFTGYRFQFHISHHP